MEEHFQSNVFSISESSKPIYETDAPTSLETLQSKKVNQNQNQNQNQNHNQDAELIRDVKLVLSLIQELVAGGAVIDSSPLEKMLEDNASLMVEKELGKLEITNPEESIKTKELGGSEITNPEESIKANMEHNRHDNVRQETLNENHVLSGEVPTEGGECNLTIIGNVENCSNQEEHLPPLDDHSAKVGSVKGEERTETDQKNGEEMKPIVLIDDVKKEKDESFEGISHPRDHTGSSVPMYVDGSELEGEDGTGTHEVPEVEKSSQPIFSKDTRGFSNGSVLEAPAVEMRQENCTNGISIKRVTENSGGIGEKHGKLVAVHDPILDGSVKTKVEEDRDELMRVGPGGGGNILTTKSMEVEDDLQMVDSVSIGKISEDAKVPSVNFGSNTAIDDFLTLTKATAGNKTQGVNTRLPEIKTESFIKSEETGNRFTDTLDGDTKVANLLNTVPKTVHRKDRKSTLDIHLSDLTSDQEVASGWLAEAILVLSGMSRLRGDRPPTEGELKLASQSYATLAGLVSQVPPKYLIGKKTARKLSEDLGLRERPKKRLRVEEETTQESQLHVPYSEVEEPSPVLQELVSPQEIEPESETEPEGLTEKEINDSIAILTSGSSQPGPISESPGLITGKGRGRPGKLVSGSNWGTNISQPVEPKQKTMTAEPPDLTPAQILAKLHLPQQLRTEYLKKQLLTQLLKAQQSYSVTFAVQKGVKGQTPLLPRQLEYPIKCEVCGHLERESQQLLMCDSCEKGYHLRCLSTFQKKNVVPPPPDWLCPKCPLEIEGKSRPPKYGPIRTRQVVGITNVGNFTSPGDFHGANSSPSPSLSRPYVGTIPGTYPTTTQVTSQVSQFQSNYHPQQTSITHPPPIMLQGYPMGSVPSPPPPPTPTPLYPVSGTNTMSFGSRMTHLLASQMNSRIGGPIMSQQQIQQSQQQSQHQVQQSQQAPQVSQIPQMFPNSQIAQNSQMFQTPQNPQIPSNSQISQISQIHQIPQNPLTPQIPQIPTPQISQPEAYQGGNSGLGLVGRIGQNSPATMSSFLVVGKYSASQSNNGHNMGSSLTKYHDLTKQFPSENYGGLARGRMITNPFEKVSSYNPKDSISSQKVNNTHMGFETNSGISSSSQTTHELLSQAMGYTESQHKSKDLKKSSSQVSSFNQSINQGINQSVSNTTSGTQQKRQEIQEMGEMGEMGHRIDNFKIREGRESLSQEGGEVGEGNLKTQSFLEMQSKKSVKIQYSVMEQTAVRLTGQENETDLLRGGEGGGGKVIRPSLEISKKEGERAEDQTNVTDKKAKWDVQLGFISEEKATGEDKERASKGENGREVGSRDDQGVGGSMMNALATGEVGTNVSRIGQNEGNTREGEERSKWDGRNPTTESQMEGIQVDNRTGGVGVGVVGVGVGVGGGVGVGRGGEGERGGVPQGTGLGSGVVLQSECVREIPNVKGGEGEGNNSIDWAWVGEPQEGENGCLYYSACQVVRTLLQINDTALFRPEIPGSPPYIARIQALWEDKGTGDKWVRVNWCFYPSDLPPVEGKPEDPQEDEVYESNHCDDNPVGSIWGPCLLLSPSPYKNEVSRRQTLLLKGLAPQEMGPPFFLCRYYYDAPTGTFQAIPDQDVH